VSDTEAACAVGCIAPDCASAGRCLARRPAPAPGEAPPPGKGTIRYQFHDDGSYTSQIITTPAAPGEAETGCDSCDEERFEQWDGVLGAFQVEVAEFVAAKLDPDIRVRAMKFAEEAGELVGAVVRLLEGRGDRAAIQAEGGDVAITLAALLDSVDVALTDTMFHRWNEIKTRTWPHLEDSDA
jgi:hypothetical protein